jgi:hypothetical protein
MIEQLRELAGLGGPGSKLANELLVIREQYESNELSLEEYRFLVKEIADVRAQQELASEELTCRYIVAAASAMLMFV